MGRTDERKNRGFTILELMVGIVVSLIALGTFFKLYINSMKNERTINLRTSVAQVGDQIAEDLSAPLRLIGLNNDYDDYTSGQVLLSTNGGSGTDAVNFRFRSPYGGPVTKLKKAATGTAPTCSFQTFNSGALHKGISEIQLLASSGIHRVTGFTLTKESSGYDAFNGGTVTLADGTAFAGNCATDFPEGTLVTGENSDYRLTYVNGGANTIIMLTNVSTGANLVNFNNNAASPYRVPFFVLQFQREFVIAGTMFRQWVSDIDEIANPTQVQEIKAIRFGFVMLSNNERVNKKVSGAGGDVSVDYCPFEGMCYTLSDLNQTAYVFRRLIHIKNFDFLQRNSDITY